jgi:hypothetical protein
MFTGVWQSSATVTVQGWWHLDTSQPIVDSSGNNRTFGSAYSTAPATGGSVAAQVIDNGVGGPLDSSGWTSTQCIQVGVGVGGKRQSSMWATGYNPPAQNYGIEIWVLPQDNGIAGGTGGWILSSGQTGGVALRINAPNGSPSYIDAYVLGPGTPIGDPVEIDTNAWMHLAIVNNAGVLTFYTNGVACGAPLASGATASAGDMYCISAPGDNQAFYGYLDEARVFTFAAGAFTTNDFLLRPRGPNIIAQPQSSVVWVNGAVTLSVDPAFDNSLLYQWRRAGINLSGQNSSTYYLNQVTAADSGNTYDVVVTSGGISVTSAVATLTVIANNPANVAAYQNAIKSEPSLLAYFPVDGDLGPTLTNAKDATHNGALELSASYDGRTNDTFGARSLSFNLDGDVQVPNNPAYEFGGSATGDGTVEALVYLSQATVSDPIIVSENYDGNTLTYYAFGASANGGSLTYRNDTAGVLTWNVPGGMVGQFAHVAWVFNGGSNVTAYVNGQNLGTQAQAGFGSGTGAPLWIGGLGTSMTDNRWAGTIDELALYSAALSQNTLQQHYSAFVYGTNTAAPSIVSQPSSKTLLAGASPVLVMQAAGTLPLTYHWSSNGTPLLTATSATLNLSNVTATATYALTVQNAYGSTNIQPVTLTVVPPPTGYPTLVMNDHPTAFWRLDDKAGDPALDSAGFNDGAYSASGVTYGVPAHQGESGHAVQLDGSSGRAIIPFSPVLNPNGPFSCEFWVLANQAFYVPLGSMPRQAQQRSGGYEFYLNGNYPGYEFHTAASGGYNMITGDDTAPTTNLWFQVVGVFDGGSNIYCYVNGRPAASTTGNPGYSDSWVSEGTSPFTPNSLAPFIIGSRQDNVRYLSGAISDVAFYNYALTPDQVSNHWTSAYVPAHIATIPASVTNAEFSTVRISPVITGLPNTYLWYKDGAPLAPSVNFDGSPHYPLDVTNATLEIAEAHPADSGQYHIVVSNPLGGATSPDVRVVVTADVNPPLVTSAQALATPPPTAGPWPFVVRVVFNTRVDPTTGGTAANYVINNGAVAVNQVTLRGDLTAPSLGSDWKVAFLQTAGLTPGQQYSLTVSGVKDQAATPNTIAPQTLTFTAPPLGQGALSWDYYYEITPQGLASLTSFQYYQQSAPTTNGYLTTFDTDQITGGDLNNNPSFGSLGDNYGDVVSGFITPAVSGDYFFFLASDDASELDLSTDSSVVNATTIATEPGCCHGFLEPDASNNTGQTTPTPISLKAGTPYFIRAFHTEGGGGDYVKVAWRLSTDNTPATNLTAIASQYLSTFVSPSAAAFNPPVYSNGQLTISWTGTGRLVESTNVALPLGQWITVTNASPYQVTPATGGSRMFYQLTQ